MPTSTIQEDDAVSKEDIIDEKLRTQLEILIEQKNPMKDAAQKALEIYN